MPSLPPSGPPSPASRGSWEPSAVVSLVTRPGCHLCDPVRQVVSATCAERDLTWEEVSVLDDPGLLERYAEQIPVTLIDGAVHDYWRIDADRFRRALDAREGSKGDPSHGTTL